MAQEAKRHREAAQEAVWRAEEATRLLTSISMRIVFGRSRRRWRADPRVIVIIGVAILYGAALVFDWLASHPAVLGAIVAVLFVAVAVAISRRFRRWSNRRFWQETIPELLTLSPSQFEVYVGSLLHDLGYRKIRQVGKAGDLAADLLCFDRGGPFGGRPM